MFKGRNKIKQTKQLKEIDFLPYFILPVSKEWKSNSIFWNHLFKLHLFPKILLLPPLPISTSGKSYPAVFFIYHNVYLAYGYYPSPLTFGRPTGREALGMVEATWIP